MGLIHFKTEKARDIIRRHVEMRLEKIMVEPGKCRYNFRCHDNAIHEAIENDWQHVAMVVYVDGNYTIPHFINLDKDGQFIDNTLGHRGRDYEYYLIKHIHREDFDNIYYFHDAIQKELISLLPFFTRIFSDIY